MSAARKRRTAWSFIAGCVLAVIALALAGRLGAYSDFAAGFAGAAGLTVLIVAALFWLRAAGAHDPGEDTAWPGDPCPYPACWHNQPQPQERGERPS